jgi:aspartyl-tRNA(Asn)/glutamyl-tRNA(Gln) amidotransferase subunit A
MTPSPPRSEGDPILELGIDGLVEAYGTGSLDPVAVTRLYLDRIARHDGQIGALADIDAHGALTAATASAARWSRGAARSALDGIPLAIKSNIAVAGLPCTAGIGAYRERRATADAGCVARLRAGGAIILGTTRMDEAALGATGDNPWFGRTLNPHDRNAITGGSSSGSAAAVAAGFCVAALGTDTFGSVRIPAAWCGVFGAKLALGAVNLEGIVPLAKSFDCLGILARYANDCRTLATCLGLAEGGGPPSPRVALTGFEGDTSGLASGLEAGLAALGIGSRSISLAPDPFGTLMRPALLIAEAEGAETHRLLLDDRDSAVSLGLRKLFDWGRARSSEERASARAAISVGRIRILDQLAESDLLVSPVTTSTAPRIGREDDRLAARFTLTASVCGLPAVSAPFGSTPEHLPRAIQITGRDWNAVLGLGEKLAMTPPIPDLDAPDQATN